MNYCMKSLKRAESYLYDKCGHKRNKRLKIFGRDYLFGQKQAKKNNQIARIVCECRLVAASAFAKGF